MTGADDRHTLSSSARALRRADQLDHLALLVDTELHWGVDKIDALGSAHVCHV